MRHYAPHSTHPQTWSARAVPPPARRPRPLATLRAALSRFLPSFSPETGGSPLDDVHTQSRLAALHRWLNLQSPLPPPAQAALLLLMQPHSNIIRRSPTACLVCGATLRNSATPQVPLQNTPGVSRWHFLRFITFWVYYLLLAFLNGFNSLRSRLSRRAAFRRKHLVLERTLANPSCFSAWYSAAEHLDLIDGRAHLDPFTRPNGVIEPLCSECHREWNSKRQVRKRRNARLHSAECINAVCDVDMITAKLRHLADAYVNGDVRSLAFALRDGLGRNSGGMCHPELHAHSRVGTNPVVEDYVNVVSYLIAYLAQSDAQLPSTPSASRSSRDADMSREALVENVRGALAAQNLSSSRQLLAEKEKYANRVMSIDDKLTFLNEARHAHGRTALMLSGGAAMGLNHLGVVKSLLEQGLLPKIVCGTSAGALVASIVGIFDDRELSGILESGQLLSPITKKPFSFKYFDDHTSAWRRFRRFLRKGFIQDVKMLQDCLRKEYGDLTFEEAYQKTKRILNITVCPVRSSLDPPLLLNYLTAPHVLIWSAASASCALPLVFAPVELVAKSASGQLVPYHPDGIRWIDGSISSDVPLSRIGELFNVNHFIVSQTNPHVIPRSLPILQSRVAMLLKSELQFRYWQASQMGIVPRLFTSIFPHFMQPYAGDVTIMPDVRLSDLTRLLTNPTLESVLGFIRRGEIQTFPFLDRIRLHCQIEQTLDSAVEYVANFASKTATMQKSPATQDNSLFGRVPSWLWLDTRSVAKPGPISSTANRHRPFNLSGAGDPSKDITEDPAVIAASEPNNTPDTAIHHSNVQLVRQSQDRDNQSDTRSEGFVELGAAPQAIRDLDEILDEISYDSLSRPLSPNLSKSRLNIVSDGSEDSGEEEERAIC